VKHKRIIFHEEWNIRKNLIVLLWYEGRIMTFDLEVFVSGAGYTLNALSKGRKKNEKN